MKRGPDFRGRRGLRVSGRNCSLGSPSCHCLSQRWREYPVAAACSREHRARLAMWSRSSRCQAQQRRALHLRRRAIRTLGIPALPYPCRKLARKSARTITRSRVPQIEPASSLQSPFEIVDEETCAAAAMFRRAERYVRCAMYVPSTCGRKRARKFWPDRATFGDICITTKGFPPHGKPLPTHPHKPN
jgi:hypothetical protein